MIRIIHNKISLSSVYLKIISDITVFDIVERMHTRIMHTYAGTHTHAHYMRKPKNQSETTVGGRVSGFCRGSGVRCPRIVGGGRPVPFLSVKIIYSLRAVNQEYTSVQSSYISTLYCIIPCGISYSLR